jgi:hypothetical protein
MRREFYEVYRDLYDVYRQSQYEAEYQRVPRRFPPIFDMRNVRTVEDAIRDAERLLPPGKSLRPDARLFLFVNTHQMVALPLSYNEGARLEQLPVDADIRSDLETIVVAAADRPESEISSHAVVSALDRVWSNLKTTSLNIWG